VRRQAKRCGGSERFERGTTGDNWRFHDGSVLGDGDSYTENGASPQIQSLALYLAQSDAATTVNRF
jgi:hypothetical protein